MNPHARNQNSANFSRLRLKSKSEANSNHNSTEKSEKISRYFISVTKGEEDASTMDIIVEDIEGSLQSSNSESPYKSSLTDINSMNVNISLNEENDFKTPKHVVQRKLKNPKLNSNQSNNVSKRGRKPKATLKLDKTDVNPDHLQLAVALSRSLQDRCKKESIENENLPSSSSLCSNTQEKIASIKQTMEQFGLRSTRKIEVQTKRMPVKRKSKKSKYQYITPILLLRTQEDRLKLISEKVATILSENSQQNVKQSVQQEPPTSTKLRKNWIDGNNIFKLNNIELNTLKNNEMFYIKSLNISPTQNKCGNLLKDWNKIPGREKSPSRENLNEKLCINNEDNNENNKIEDLKKINIDLTNTTTESDALSNTFKNNLKIKSFTRSPRSISPELFESDEEEVIEIVKQKSLHETLINLDEEHNSQSLLHLTPKKNKFISIDLSPNKETDINSESVLKFTPKKKNKSLDKSNLEVTVTSPILMNISKESSLQISNTKNNSASSDLSDDDLFVNDNGICTFECFSNDHPICYDLTQSSDEENFTVDDKKDRYVNVNQTVQNITPTKSVRIQSSLSSGISGIMEKSLYLTEENVEVITNKETPESKRCSKSLNITDYINNILTEEEDCLHDEVQQNFQMEPNNIFDFNQRSFGTDQNVISNIAKGKVNKSETSNTRDSSFVKHDSFKSTTSDEVTLSQGSQESIYISDEELNYSSVYGTPCIKKKEVFIQEDNFLFEISDDDDVTAKVPTHNSDKKLHSTPKTTKEDFNESQLSDSYEEIINTPTVFSQSILPHPRTIDLSTNTPTVIKSRKSLFGGANLLDDTFNIALENPDLYNEVQEAGPSSITSRTIAEHKPQEPNTTPKGEMLIKTSNITPMINYKEMNTPKITKELQKFGLKPLKRQRGIQILKHIYESTHPVLSQTAQNGAKSESDDEHRIIKKRKSSNSKINGSKNSSSPKKRKNLQDQFYNEKELAESEDAMKYVNKHKTSEEIEIIGDLIGENETVNDLIFERKHSTKIQSCRVPLHIAWHNLVSSQPELRKNILLYEPLQLEVLYKLLKEQGYKYHIQDLLTFLDRKCITIRSNQNQQRNSRQRKKLVSPQ